jgi:DNA-binding CsgD family transcriptional regulator
MFLTGHQTELLARVMTTLAEPHEERDIRTRVGSLMLDLLQAQFYASYVWDPLQQRFDEGVQINMDPGNLARYEAYYQFHDPITFTLQQHRRAVRVSDVMPQPALERTEFFNDFLARDGLHRGVNLYAWSGQRNVGDMRIWRDRRRPDFTRDDLELLDLVQPALTAALQRCRGAEGVAPLTAPAPGVLSCLSAREREVAHLAACGLGDKEIARRLGISPTTVRTHVEHAYRKLGVNNRVALARLACRSD